MLHVVVVGSAGATQNELFLLVGLGDPSPCAGSVCPILQLQGSLKLVEPPEHPAIGEMQHKEHPPHN